MIVGAGFSLLLSTDPSSSGPLELLGPAAAVLASIYVQVPARSPLSQNILVSHSDAVRLRVSNQPRALIPVLGPRTRKRPRVAVRAKLLLVRRVVHCNSASF